MQRLPPDWARFHADVDYESRLALVVESPEDADTLIAVARYEPAGEPDTQLNGIRRFRAWVLADNRRMLDLIVRLGEVSQRSIDQGVVELTFTARGRSPGS